MTAPRLIQGEGTTGQTWQAWPGLRQLGQVSLNALLGARQRLVVLTPHPDDEILSCGGLLACHAARGGASLVVAVTDGEASHKGLPGWNADRLAERRRRESVSGLALLGRFGSDSLRVVRLGMKDGGVGPCAEQLLGSLRRLLASDDLVVSTWCFDGHPDHDAVGAAAIAGCAAVGCKLVQAPVWMWHWSCPDDSRVPWSRLHRLSLPASVVNAKQSALSAHASQLEARRDERFQLLDPVLGRQIQDRAGWDCEYYFL